ncbi:hypothetical protein HZB96_03040, partial [Candidatus Gottesmanbacteria bacterium]|nr:hypothetical protein [Candidatus Gottesmanbacteria bacterium]
MREKLIVALLAIGIFLLASFFRLYGVNWDQNQHLHPDERFLTMVAGAISWPRSAGEYLDASTSPLNPHNRGFGFFVYGTFPIFFTKWVAELLDKADYNQLTIVGRQLSAIFDLGTVALVFLIAKSVIPTELKRVEGSLANARSSNKLRDSSTEFTLSLSNVLGMTSRTYWIFPLIAMFLYSIMVLPIQLSHFFAVDTYLTFFITLSFYLLIRIICHAEFISASNSNTREILRQAQDDKWKKILNSKIPHPSPLLIGEGLSVRFLYPILLGLSFGLALASKISALLFLPIIGLGIIIFFLRNRNLFMLFVLCSMFLFSSYLTFRLTQPYLFATGNIFDITLNQKVLDNWKQLKSFNDPKGWFPPAVQWIKTKPYIYPLKNMILWGLGLPLGIISIASSIYIIGLLGYWVIGLFKKKQLTI